MFFMLANFKRNFLTLYCQLNEYLGCCYSFLSALTPLVRWQTNNTGPCVVHIVAVVMGSWFICGPHTVVHLKQDLYCLPHCCSTQRPNIASDWLSMV